MCVCVCVCLTQVGNAFVSRRLGLELDFFSGVLKGPIFMSIMTFICVLQVIIMQTPVGYIFKVRACSTHTHTHADRRQLAASPSPCITLLSRLFCLGPALQRHSALTRRMFN